MNAGETFIIPSGWIHAVYTPINSLVVGGNFIHSFSIQTQLKCYEIETTVLKIKERYSFPFFKPLMWYVASHELIRMREMLLERQDQQGQGQDTHGTMDWLSAYEIEGLPILIETLRKWHYELESNQTTLKTSSLTSSSLTSSSKGSSTVNLKLKLRRTEEAHEVAARLCDAETALDMLDELEKLLETYSRVDETRDINTAEQVVGDAVNEVRPRLKLKFKSLPKTDLSKNDVKNNESAEIKQESTNIQSKKIILKFSQSNLTKSIPTSCTVKDEHVVLKEEINQSQALRKKLTLKLPSTSVTEEATNVNCSVIGCQIQDKKQFKMSHLNRRVNGCLTYNEIFEQEEKATTHQVVTNKQYHYPPSWKINSSTTSDEIYPLCVEHEDERCKCLLSLLYISLFFF